jgi:2,4-dienoyl-CoA reductase-like NADH-dependent reductase (Old Yellow Enzyme family)
MTDTAEPRLLTEEDILAVDDIETEVVPVPEWGGSVRLRGLSLDEVLEARKGATGDTAAMSVRLLAAAFAEPKLSEAAVAALGRKSASVVTRLLQVATRLSGIDAEAVQRSERTFRTEPGDGVPVPPGP